MRKSNKTEKDGLPSPSNQPPYPEGGQTLRAANDNGRSRRSVVMLNFDNIAVQADEVAVIDALMQAWPIGVNDNFPVASVTSGQETSDA